jgi:hypothetical protein
MNYKQNPRIFYAMWRRIKRPTVFLGDLGNGAANQGDYV